MKVTAWYNYHYWWWDIKSWLCHFKIWKCSECKEDEKLGDIQ